MVRINWIIQNYFSSDIGVLIKNVSMKSSAIFSTSKNRTQLMVGVHTSALNSMNGSRWGPHLWEGTQHFCVYMHTYNCRGLFLNLISTIQPMKKTLILFGVCAHAPMHTHLHKALFINSKGKIFTIYPFCVFQYTGSNVMFNREQILQNSGFLLFIF